jgi:hypothetical protein
LLPVAGGLVRRPCGFGQSVLELCFLGTRITADQSCAGLAFIELTAMPNVSASICLRSAEFVEDIELERDVACPRSVTQG